MTYRTSFRVFGYTLSRIFQGQIDADARFGYSDPEFSVANAISDTNSHQLRTLIMRVDQVQPIAGCCTMGNKRVVQGLGTSDCKCALSKWPVKVCYSESCE